MPTIIKISPDNSFSPQNLRKLMSASASMKLLAMEQRKNLETAIAQNKKGVMKELFTVLSEEKKTLEKINGDFVKKTTDAFKLYSQSLKALERNMVEIKNKRAEMKEESDETDLLNKLKKL
jgi:flagellar biosynthesis/type III secretory pathway chaperone